MRVPFGDMVRGWSAVTRPLDWLKLTERVVLALLMLQVVRFAWVIVTPVGSFGPWEGRQAQLMPMAGRQALFASFDPFFGSDAREATGNAVVTSLALTLFGVRLNEGSGLGSAIIATPDGVQNSYAVGDQIMPGVVLKAVAFDHVSIDRGGAEEQIFLDQSTPVGTTAPAEASQDRASAPPPPQVDGPVTADMLKRDVGFAPRMEDGRVTGLVLSSRGPGFAAAGFRPGDIISKINGQPVGAAGDLQTLQNQIAPGARLSLTVERGAAVASVNLIVQGQ
ncbi:general secretion pathway protein C [Sphingobium sp. OAS761]|uniref:type II secretion system protein N n=1 Tax=Sphingobium sp. OAS761 TaxID=2817901 RepID=UPI00209CAAD8|nr:type II secretion system protein N [Sphingobium sp. OAS761]MCP1471051.1 general secretion pathway protein C [Sphingobium sp. OAS761]